MNNWSTQKLGDIVKTGGGKIHTGPFGSQLHAADYVSTGIPCIMPANMENNRVNLSEISFISDTDALRLSKYLVESGDIVYSRRGDVTQKALIEENEAGYFCGTGCLLIRPGSEIDSHFLTYYLSLNNIKKWIKKQAVGATMPNLNTAILASIPFTSPIKKEQKKISSLLQNIDKKIELNNKINAELEAMAKLIYDYWFVQFDFPDANGKPYKSSGGKMVYNEVLKREVPKHWEVNEISKLFFYQEGPGITKEKYSTNGHKFINIKCIKENDLNVDRASMIEPSYIEKYRHFLLEENDIVVSTSGSLGRSAIVRKEHLPLLLNTSVIRFKPLAESSFEYMSEYLKSDYFLGRLNQMATGSIQKNFGPTHLDQMQDVIPEGYLLCKFSSILKPLVKKQLLSNSENDKLFKLRDWLLPMLMNGQVTVKNPQPNES